VAEKMEVKRNNTEYCCPECDFVHDEIGAVRLHYYWKHGKGAKNKKVKVEKVVDAVGCCEHDFRLLDAADSEESRIIRMGYKKICEKCEEVN